ADLPERQAAVMAATRRRRGFRRAERNSGLADAAVLGGGRHRAAGSDVVRSMAERAKATIVEVEGSHVIMISQPRAVTDVILQAIDAVR
ncbi:MAG TPA: hypothetical protein VNO31_45185, partial [Umezawaea sp.]|nr:hypothetical protein [Umezawaea sp.]